MRDEPREKKNRVYEELRGLYETCPEKFEERRRQLIEEAISRFPAARRQRALGWQFRLEASLRHYRDPLARMNKMVEILWGQIETLRQALNGTLPRQDPSRLRQEDAKVLPFPSSRTRH